MSISVKLLEKLTLDKDLSVGREALNRGRFRYFFSTFKSNMTGVLLMNLLFLLFVLPIAIVLLLIMPQYEKIIASTGYFAGELGMGFPGVNNDYETISIAIYNFRMIVFASVIPGFALVGVGFAGVMRCCRNWLWGAKVKIRKQFWRGVKENWLKYMIAFTVIGIAFGGVSLSILNYLKMSVVGVAPWWTWLSMVGCCLFALLLLYFMIIYLPHLSMFKMKHKHIIKNTLLLDLVLILPATILLVIMGLPFLTFLSSTTASIFGIIFIMFGFGFYSLGIASFGMFAADNFVIALYNQKIEDEEREKLRAIQSERKKKNKVQPSKKKGNR